jgi:hypothetical protein
MTAPATKARSKRPPTEPPKAAPITVQVFEE